MAGLATSSNTSFCVAVPEKTLVKVNSCDRSLPSCKVFTLVSSTRTIDPSPAILGLMRKYTGTLASAGAELVFNRDAKSVVVFAELTESFLSGEMEIKFNLEVAAGIAMFCAFSNGHFLQCGQGR